ncbi:MULTISPECIES: hypothetical protein [unclassified Shewanella]|uniref:hypothetical protein n=1 Tax=unclassified Shewanella TaxID=196818 RepID=UPI000C83C0D6|nr:MULTISPECIES: hypothetical protein [unclassified Shewanella]PMG27576.1 hypothetical protein BCU94_04230 [Shewanella sp. 10N.286.52.C2]PMG49020.1 hypothetical protein BCU91_18600 [Shewanella sp. 10N.286.52.B9]PMH86667.1 hypothetical protein BCU57_11070 [Shewanella sp. 10N.286.48.B5]PMH95148.1 hypothetical protein BCU55_02920 [Shewanella sp. 10N.286.48.A6]
MSQFFTLLNLSLLDVTLEYVTLADASVIDSITQANAFQTTYVVILRYFTRPSDVIRAASIKHLKHLAAYYAPVLPSALISHNNLIRGDL